MAHSVGRLLLSSPSPSPPPPPPPSLLLSLRGVSGPLPGSPPFLSSLPSFAFVVDYHIGSRSGKLGAGCRCVGGWFGEETSELRAQQMSVRGCLRQNLRAERSSNLCRRVRPRIPSALGAHQVARTSWTASSSCSPGNSSTVHAVHRWCLVALPKLPIAIGSIAANTVWWSRRTLGNIMVTVELTSDETRAVARNGYPVTRTSEGPRGGGRREEGGGGGQCPSGTLPLSNLSGVEDVGSCTPLWGAATRHYARDLPGSGVPQTDSGPPVSGGLPRRLDGVPREHTRGEVVAHRTPFLVERRAQKVRGSFRVHAVPA